MADRIEPDAVGKVLDDDPEVFRRRAHRLVDWMADLLAGIEERTPWAHVSPGDVRGALAASPPSGPEDLEAIVADLDRVIVPGTAMWQHPNWFAYFPGNTSTPAVLAEMVAATLASQSMLWRSGPAANELEHLVLDWLVDLLALPRSMRVDVGPGVGVIQPSASDATHLALVVARHRATTSGHPMSSLVAYTSAQAHSSVEKGARVAGYQHVRLVDVDPVTRALRPDALVAAIEEDLAAGRVPTFACSTIGTTGTGAVDPVAEVGAVARQHGLWHHVDAAWAGAYRLCEELRTDGGLDTADSFVTNPHKLLHTGVDFSAFWVADRQPLLDAMAITPAYLRTEASDRGAVIDHRDLSVSLGRRFRALKLWFVLRLFGVDAIADGLRAHVAMATWLADHVDADPHLVQFAPRSNGLVCVAHADGEAATRRMIAAVEADPTIAVTASEEDGRAYLRLSIGQTHTRHEHVRRLATIVTAAARAVAEP